MDFVLRWQQWNRKAQKWLLALTLIGMIAAVPLGVVRVQMEQTSKEVEFVFNYRNLVQIASYHAHPRAFLNEHLKQMKNAGITTMAVFESTLAELSTAGRLTLYNGTQAATLQGKLPTVGENYTYLLFTGPEEEAAIRPMIEETFARLDIPFGSWSFGGRNGMVIQTPVEDAILKTMPPDPMALKQLKDAGFQILPRLSDRVRPYDPDATERMLAGFAELGVKRILFDGNSVKGYNDNAELKSLEHFGKLLNRYGIGVVSIENMRVPQAGLSRLALLTDYNIVRLYSLSDGDAAAMSPDAIADRFLLAAKDRNIRMFYMNGAPTRSLEQGGVVHPLDNIYKAIGSEEGAVERLASFGFSSGSAGHFDVKTYGWQTPVKGVVALGAIALIALLVGAFVPVLLIPAFILGLLGSAGIYLVLSGSLLEQALALGASISAPTLAMVWAVNRVRNRTDGARRAVGGTDWTIAARSGAFGGKESDAEEGRPVRWMFDGLSAGKRFGSPLRFCRDVAYFARRGSVRGRAAERRNLQPCAGAVPGRQPASSRADCAYRRLSVPVYRGVGRRQRQTDFEDADYSAVGGRSGRARSGRHVLYVAHGQRRNGYVARAVLPQYARVDIRGSSAVQRIFAVASAVYIRIVRGASISGCLGIVNCGVDRPVVDGRHVRPYSYAAAHLGDSRSSRPRPRRGDRNRHHRSVASR
ncbi:hypothetical protein PACILC2_05620 [Paenibacillus cisolokensis]|uniref:Uncharacterized protein n=1 Tax=Paenibacillus cisolokensis TaxID=1658519 RepID=A0ABQ4N1G1_9BACL|nr:hypothetical protein PACILC2_05620 [Paenibacillus cisolokensis]